TFQYGYVSVLTRRQKKFLLAPKELRNVATDKVGRSADKTDTRPTRCPIHPLVEFRISRSFCHTVLHLSPSWTARVRSKHNSPRENDSAKAASNSSSVPAFPLLLSPSGSCPR